jgi:hypothetical protein
MTVLTEGKYPFEFLVSEAPGTISRDTVTVTVPANTTIATAAVLGQVAATGKYIPYDEAVSDGSEDAAAILCVALVNATGAPVDMDGVVINFAAEVRRDDLVFEDGVDEDKAIADLAARGIKARPSQ